MFSLNFHLKTLFDFWVDFNENSILVFQIPIYWRYIVGVKASVHNDRGKWNLYVRLSIVKVDQYIDSKYWSISYLKVCKSVKFRWFSGRSHVIIGGQGWPEGEIGITSAFIPNREISLSLEWPTVLRFPNISLILDKCTCLNKIE